MALYKILLSSKWLKVLRQLKNNQGKLIKRKCIISSFPGVSGPVLIHTHSITNTRTLKHLFLLSFNKSRLLPLQGLCTCRIRSLPLRSLLGYFLGHSDLSSKCNPSSEYPTVIYCQHLPKEWASKEQRRSLIFPPLRTTPDLQYLYTFVGWIHEWMKYFWINFAAVSFYSYTDYQINKPKV